MHASTLQEYVEELCRSYTGPALLYDMGAVRQQIDTLRSLEERHRCTFLFTVKAFADIRVLSLFARHGVGFDISNVGELGLVRSVLGATESGQGEILSMTGPLLHTIVERNDPAGESPALLPARTIMLNVGSLGQLEWLRSLRRQGKRSMEGIVLGARITIVPEKELRESGGTLISRFGFDPEDHTVLRELAEWPEFQGLHAHLGVKISQPAPYLQAATRLVELITKLQAPISYINLGGGFRGFSQTMLEEMLGRLREIVPDTIRLFFEPGDYWFERAGYAICKVVDVMEKPERNTMLITADISADCHLKWSEPELLINADGGERSATILVCGSTCHEGDLIGAYMGPARIGEKSIIGLDDLLLFRNVSSYSASWNASFNGIPKANVVLHGEYE